MRTLPSIVLSLACIATLASCKKDDPTPQYQVVPDQKGPSAVVADAGWEQVANLAFVTNSASEQYRFMALSLREGFVSAAIQASYQGQQGVINNVSTGYVDADGYFRYAVKPAGEHKFSFERPETGGGYGLLNQNYFAQGRPFSVMTYSRSTAGNMFYRLTLNGAATHITDLGYGQLLNNAFSATSNGNTATGYYCYTWFNGISYQKLVEFDTRLIIHDIPLALRGYQAPSPALASDAQGILHIVLVRRGTSRPTQLFHYTKTQYAPPALADSAEVTLPEATRYDLFAQGNKLVLCARIENRGVFVDARTGAPLADVSVSRNADNSPLLAAALHPDGTPVVGFSDPSVGDRLTVLRCTGSTTTPVGKPGITNGASGALLTNLNGMLYAGVVNQEARSLAIIRLK